MCSCWEEITDQRPTFIELMRRLRQLEEKSTTTSLIDEELISIKQVESPKTKHRTLLSPNYGRLMTQTVLGERNSFRFQV
jgi:hypothetical protein